MNENKEPAGLTAFREHILTAEAYLLCTPSGRVRYASGPLKLMIEGDLSGRNLNDFLEDATAARLIAETLAGNPPELWTLCGNWQHTVWHEHRHPSARSRSS